ncbi:MAG: DUF2621 family protein [Candidatus Omnitrophota bacterium]
MMNSQEQVIWEDESLKKFNKMIARIPLFHREIARKVAFKKAELNAKERGSKKVEEPDIIKAFFSEVPMTFYSLMIKLLEDAGFDYKRYVAK